MPASRARPAAHRMRLEERLHVRNDSAEHPCTTLCHTKTPNNIFEHFRYLFYLRNRPPPRSTLFPYTTLFRSLGVLSASPRAATGACRTPAVPLGRYHASRGTRARRGAARSRARETGRAGRGRTADCRVRADRKSTRLNSSHRTISYAVFCLKK